MNTAEVSAFLVRYPPFDSLAPEQLETVAAATSLRSYVEGETILVEDGLPAENLYVVAKGAVDFVHQGEIVDVIELGESFAHPSLLTGMAPTFTIKAREGTACLLVPREQALIVLGRPAGAAYVATSLRRRLTRTGHLVHAMPSLGTTKIEELISRSPVFCPGATPISEVAKLMTKDHLSAVLIENGDRLFVLTDAVLRGRVATGEVPPDAPASAVAVMAVVARPDRLAVDAIVDMLDGGADHLLVADSKRTVLGVLSATDLMGVETRSPFALRHAILRAHDEDELVAAAALLPRLFLALLEAGVPPLDIGRVLSLQVDTITMRLLDLAFERHGPMEIPWAWLALGSVARRETTLASDQENALAFANSDDDPAVDAYFERVATDVNRALTRCGFGLDANGVAASNRLWRMSESQWIATFNECLEDPDPSHLIRANVAFDFRQTGGGLDIVPPLVAILRDARHHPHFLRLLTRPATDFKPPLGFRGSLVGNEIDLKVGGLIPIANLARFFALANGITISSTLDRLVAVEEVGALDGEISAGLREAFAALAGIRLHHHAAQIARGEAPNNVVDPDELPPLTRTQLRESFRAIARAQKQLAVYVPLGIN
jgi:CBS domain-containing protein